MPASRKRLSFLKLELSSLSKAKKLRLPHFPKNRLKWPSLPRHPKLKFPPFSPRHRKLFQKYAWPLEKLKPLSLLFSAKHHHSRVDSMFFQFEELPVLGKEYWFLYLVDPRSATHFVLMFGRAQGSVQINQRFLSQKKDKTLANPVPCAVLWWGYSQGKKKFGDFKSDVAIQKNPNRISDSQNNLSFQGTYPDYSLSLSKNGHALLSLQFSARKKGKPFELGHFSTSVFGFELVNLFLKCKGSLLGEPFSGEAYVQKVIAVGPFVPWNWARLYFEDGSTFDYFSLRFTPSQSWGSLAPSRAVFWDAKTNKTKSFEQLTLQKERSSGSWLIWDKEKRLLLRLVPKAHHDFLFKSTGEFHYGQYLVEALPQEINGGKLAGRASPRAEGLFEDAYGFML